MRLFFNIYLISLEFLTIFLNYTQFPFKKNLKKIKNAYYKWINMVIDIILNLINGANESWICIDEGVPLPYARRCTFHLKRVHSDHIGI